MNANMTSKVSFPPRGLVIVTGEDILSLSSLQARIFPIAMDKRDIDLRRLTTFQYGSTELLPTAMYGYLDWIRMNALNRETAFREFLRDLFRQAQADFTFRMKGENIHGRTPSNAAHLWVGWYTFMSYARVQGAISEKQQSALMGRMRAALLGQMKAQAVDAVQDDPVENFLRVLRDLLAAGKVRLEEPEKEISPSPTRTSSGGRCRTGKCTSFGPRPSTPSREQWQRAASTCRCRKKRLEAPQG